MAAASSVFHRVRTGSKIGAQYDQDGNLIQVETREDEEQSIKLAEMLELLLAAGYFRARIKGLSPFDKVVGGMTWCITTCNFDIDVDLLFQENSTIGQKISLTEKIVSVLPKMKCPHRLEPHQIQGLDFIHIFPVIQWLVKRAIETREEMGDTVRAYSICQFQKSHSLPEDEEFLQRKDKAVSAVLNVLEVYKPQRRYRRQTDAGELQDEESRVHSTLLEYGSHSPDLNPIEHALHLLKTKLKGNKQGLKTAAVEAWQSISRDQTQRLVYGFQISGSDCKGFATRY